MIGNERVPPIQCCLVPSRPIPFSTFSRRQFGILHNTGMGRGRKTVVVYFAVGGGGGDGGCGGGVSDLEARTYREGVENYRPYFKIIIIDTVAEALQERRRCSRNT